MPVSQSYDTEVYNLATEKNAQLIIKSMITGEGEGKKFVGTNVRFPAFLTSFTQTFTSNWNEEDVYGRMDPIATFQNTRRAINLAFDCPAPNLRTAKTNLKNCNTLASFLYPGYIDQPELGAVADAEGKIKSAGKIISRPPLVSVKFANLINGGGSAKSTTRGGQLGYMSGLEWSPVLEMGMFRDGYSFYPKVISLSFTLNVLHQGVKGWGIRESGTEGWLSSKFFK